MAREDVPVALVTGSARGLGLAVAERLAARGERVHTVWRTPGRRAEGLRKRFGPRAHRADLARPGDARELVGSVLALDGRLDRVVHAVGDYAPGAPSEATLDELRHMLASNVESAFLLFGAAREALRARGGQAVFFGCAGLAGLRGRRRTALYAAAKCALLVLVRSWALEEAPHGVTVNMVSPGHVPHEGAHEDTLDAELHARIPFGRPGEPDDVARAVAWLCSDDAAYTTGTDLFVGGGWML